MAYLFREADRSKVLERLRFYMGSPGCWTRIRVADDLFTGERSH